MRVVCSRCSNWRPVRFQGGPPLKSLTCTFCGALGSLKRAPRRKPGELAEEEKSARAALAALPPVPLPASREVAALERQAAAQERIADALDRFAFHDAEPNPAKAPSPRAFVAALAKRARTGRKATTARIPTVSPTLADCSPAELEIAKRNIVTAPEGGAA